METRPWHATYDEGVPTAIDIDEVTIPEHLQRSAQAYPERTALIFKNRRVSYERLWRDTCRLATAFVRMGVEPGDRIAIHLPNLPQTVVSYYAALSAGARVVLTNPLYTGPELVHQWNDAGCKVAVTADFLFESRVKHIRAQVPVRDYLIASIPEALAFPRNLLAPLVLGRRNPPLTARVTAEDGVHRFAELVRRTPPRELPRTHFEDVAVLQYTGGTTGLSKGAQLTHRNLSVNLQQVNAWFGSPGKGGEVMLVCLPIFHVFGMNLCMNWSVAMAATMVLEPDPRDLPALLRSIARHRVTLFPAVPAIYGGLLEHPLSASTDLSSLKACMSGSAPIAPEIMGRFEALSGAPMVEGFGLSETAPVTHCNPVFGGRRPGWVGVPLPSTDARVVDLETGMRDVAPGEEGELIVRGPQIMVGYWNQPAETSDVLRDGWFHTGDIVVSSEDGYIRIAGRKKDMINCSGMKVYPDEVDHVLAQHANIVEAATIGVPHPERGETVRSYIVAREGTELSLEEVQRHCEESLAPFKIPREVRFIDALPRSTVLKVLRRELREQALREH